LRKDLAMIVDFTIRNYRSLKDECLFSMVAEKKKEDMPWNIYTLPEGDISLLKTAIIYGANASGKSNIIRAFDMLRQCILNSDTLKLDQEIPYYEPFFLDTETRSSSIACEIEFVTQEPMRYRYSFEFDQSHIIAEKLVFFPHKGETLLYKRNAVNEYVWGRELKGKKQSIVDDVLGNMLFLSKAANKNDSDEKLKNVYRYFSSGMSFHTSTDSTKKPIFFTSQKLRSDVDGSFRRKVVEFLRSADVGVSSLRTRHEASDPNENIIELGHRVYKNHTDAGDEHYFTLDNESAGTVKMFDLAGKIIATLQQGGVIIVDELDSSFHPLMSEYVISLFNDPVKNPNNAQLIVATHDVSLLDSEKLRRDQIWFAEKDQYGATTIFSLDEFKESERRVRQNIPFDSWYLAGRFGALPVIDKKLFSIAEKKG
jgi:AAA15 family ATPase/GTPase